MPPLLLVLAATPAKVGTPMILKTHEDYSAKVHWIKMLTDTLKGVFRTQSNI